MATTSDLKEYRIAKGDRFFVDTNVWYWSTYVASRKAPLPQSPRNYQMECYPRFIDQVTAAGGELFHCPLILAELTNIIESAEMDLHRCYFPERKLTRKRFRALQAERSGVLKEVRQAWAEICDQSSCIKLDLEDDAVAAAFDILEGSQLDTYDAFYLLVMQRMNIRKIITDDGDFEAADNIEIVTANPGLLD